MKSRADDVERARLARQHPARVAEPSEHERPDAVTVAHADEVGLVHQHEREPALERRQHAVERDLEVTTVGARLRRVHRRDQLGDERGVGGGVELPAAGEHAGQHPELRRQVRGVGQVAVVTEGEARVCDLAVHRLRVAPRARTGRRVADMPDREVTVERREVALVEHLGDEAHVLDDGDGLAVAHRDAGRLLAPVLERVEAVVGELGHGLARRVHAEHPARVSVPGIHRSSIADRR